MEEPDRKHVDENWKGKEGKIFNSPPFWPLGAQWNSKGRTPSALPRCFPIAGRSGRVGRPEQACELQDAHVCFAITKLLVLFASMSLDLAMFLDPLMLPF